jgi:hypothetical protein
MEGKGTIQDVSLKQGAKGDFYKLLIDKRSYSVFQGTSAFSSLEAKEVKKGDAVEFEYTEAPGTFNGQAVTYKNIQAIIKASGEKKNQDEETEEPEELINIPLESPTEVAKKAIEVTKALLEGLECEGTVEIVAARKDVFAQLMTDRRANLIQSFKKSNIREIRR